MSEMLYRLLFLTQKCGALFSGLRHVLQPRRIHVFGLMNKPCFLSRKFLTPAPGSHALSLSFSLFLSLCPSLKDAHMSARAAVNAHCFVPWPSAQGHSGFDRTASFRHFISGWKSCLPRPPPPLLSTRQAVGVKGVDYHQESSKIRLVSAQSAPAFRSEHGLTGFCLITTMF